MIKQYSKYKNSGVQWLGDIPSHWKAVKLKYVGDAFIGMTYSPEDVVDDETEGVLILRSSNIQNGNLLLNDNVYVKKQIPEKLFVRKNDILLCSRNGSRDLIGKNILISEECHGMSFGAFMTVYRTQYPEFIYYFFNSPIFKALSSLFLSSTINQLTLGVLNDMIIALPPKEEQHQICLFLREQLSTINSLIEEKVKSIQRLKEKSLSIVNEAITKGLNPSVDMKETGIKYLGSIPSHWELKKCRYNTYMKGRIGWQGLKHEEFTNEGPFLITGMNFKNGKINWDEVYHISQERFDEAPEIQLKEGDVLFTKDGTIGKLLYVDYLPGPASLNSHLLVLRPLDGSYISKYLYYQLMSMPFLVHIELNKVGTTFYGITQEAFGRYKMILPPLSEQNEIVSYLDRNTNLIEVMVDDIEYQIDQLKEYRQSVISEAVTGKIDLREWEPNSALQIA